MKWIDNITVTPEMLSLISEIDEFKGAWRALGKLAPERLRQLRKVATIESVGSSTRIEGAKLSDREVEALLSRLETKSFQTRDEQEVAGYAVVMEEIFTSFDAIPLSENYIKQLHQMLLQFSGKDERHRGQYKTTPNHVEAFDPSGKSVGIVFETATPFDTPRKMEELVVWTNEALNSKSLHPLLITGMMIVAFLAIHPFQDGNGRLSRILTTLLLLRQGYAYVPYSSMESVVEENKEAYYLALRRTQKSLDSDAPEWQHWLLFFLRTLQKQKRNLEQKVERERIMRAALPELSVAIIELIQGHERISMAEIERLTKASRSTIKQRLTELVEQGHIHRHGQGRSTWYSLS